MRNNRFEKLRDRVSSHSNDEKSGVQFGKEEKLCRNIMLLISPMRTQIIIACP